MLRFAATLSAAVLVFLAFFVGRASSSVQEVPGRLLMMEFEIGPEQTPNEAITELSDWVRIARATGKHESAKLFMHEWGQGASLYIVVETDWDGIEAFFTDLLEARPRFMDQPFGFAGHADNIMTEIPVQ